MALGAAGSQAVAVVRIAVAPTGRASPALARWDVPTSRLHCPPSHLQVPAPAMAAAPPRQTHQPPGDPQPAHASQRPDPLQRTCGTQVDRCRRRRPTSAYIGRHVRLLHALPCASVGACAGASAGPAPLLCHCASRCSSAATRRRSPAIHTSAITTPTGTASSTRATNTIIVSNAAIPEPASSRMRAPYSLGLRLGRQSLAQTMDEASGSCSRMRACAMPHTRKRPENRAL